MNDVHLKDDGDDAERFLVTFAVNKVLMLIGGEEATSGMTVFNTT